MTAGIAVGGWPDERAVWLLGAILNHPGLALFVSGLSPYLPQGFPERVREDNRCLRGSDGRQQAGQEGQFSIDLEFLAALIIFGFVCWGRAEWIARR
jgi:hypothetical protein